MSSEEVIIKEQTTDNNKIRNTIVVLISCKWDDVEKYILNELTAITHNHWVTYKTLNNSCDAEEILKDAEKYMNPLKLLLVVNDSKKTNRYFHIYKLHMGMNNLVKACIPFFTEALEDTLCVRHDTMSLAMKEICDEQIDEIKKMFNSDAIKIF